MDKIRKMDELEMTISYVAIKTSYFFTTMFLVIWSIYDIINGQKVSISSMLLAANIIILILMGFIAKKKFDIYKNKTFSIFFVSIGFLLIFVLLIGFFINKYL